MRDWKSILVSAEDSDDLSEALETLALDNGVSLLVTDADGASLYSAQYNPRGTMNTLRRIPSKNCMLRHRHPAEKRRSNIWAVCSLI